MTNNKYKVLLIEDDENLRSVMATMLGAAGYQVILAETCNLAITLFTSHLPDVSILVLGLPDMNGMRFLEFVRKSSLSPIIVLSARNNDTDKVLALDAGANDYVTKPFPMSVFQKKLAVVLGRLTKQYGGDTYEDGTLTINFSEMSAALSGKPLTFTPLEYRLLKILMKNPQIVLTRQVLLEKLWDADGNFVDEHALTAAISRVRNKIETPDRQYIKTVYGMGYMWIGGVLK